MKKYTEWKNNTEVTETFETFEEVKNSAIGWLETYEVIDEDNGESTSTYDVYMRLVSECDTLSTINDIMEPFGYSYTEEVFA